tara:strand:+ start:334 stop:1020 length:687 start_codon:yes stop_codon:yes gene_type:complete
MLPRVDVPQYEAIIPSTGETIKFRPFLVKEEKILMLASEEGDYKGMVNACHQIVQNCTNGELAEDMTMFDMQDVFIKIRSKSVGETQEFSLICGECEKSISYDLELENLTAKGLDNLPDTNIKVGDDFIVVMKYPSAKEVADLEDMTDIDVISKCIVSIVTEEEETLIKDVSDEELMEFLEELPLSAMDQMREFFRSMPYVEHRVEYTCPHCEAEQAISINGYEHFFA